MFLEQTADVAQPASTRDLLAEANHRIANSLSLVAALARQQLGGLKDDNATLAASEVRGLLLQLAGRIDAVSRLHRMLSQGESEKPIDIGGYLQQVASEAVASMAKPDRVVLHFATELGCRVPPERALHIGLIVVELVVNSIKHAHPAGIQGHIEIRCRRDPGAIVVDVTDDGVGLPEVFDEKAGAHAGLRLVNALARQIGASVRFESGGLGLRCEITAPVAAAV